MTEKLQEQQKAADEFAALHRLNVKAGSAAPVAAGADEGGSQGVLI